MRSLTKPHYLLFSESAPAKPGGVELEGAGSWRFQLESIDGSATFAATDEESGMTTERLELLAVIRGLEALDQPSEVTLVTSSRYVSHGIRFGLAGWRETRWRWEHFGRMTPICNADLWQRIDRALAIHRVRCQAWRMSASAVPATSATRRGPGRVGALDSSPLWVRIWRGLFGWVGPRWPARFRLHSPVLCPQ